MKNVYKFDNCQHDLDFYKDSLPYKLMEKLNNGETLNHEEKDYIVINAYNMGLMRVGDDYIFDFSNFMQLFIVAKKNGQMQQQYAFDKEQIFKHLEYVDMIYTISEVSLRK